MSIKSVKEQFDKIAPDLKIIEFDEPTATVEQAAKAHNVEPGQIVKTIALALNTARLGVRETYTNCARAYLTAL